MKDRQNTINGWVLFAGIVALGASIVTGEIFHSERPEKMGYPIEGVAAEGEGGEAEQPIAFYLASADDVTGQIFAVRANEIFLMSQSRPIRSVHRAGGWTPESIGEHAIPALRPHFYPLDRSQDSFSWDPL